MARPLNFPEATMARFRKGTFDRIERALDTGQKEDRASLIRDAVERELKRRERTSPNPAKQI